MIDVPRFAPSSNGSRIGRVRSSSLFIQPVLQLTQTSGRTIVRVSQVPTSLSSLYSSTRP
jgi:hypothetical protein